METNSKLKNLRREVEYLDELTREFDADGRTQDAESARTELGHARIELSLELERASKRAKARDRYAARSEVLSSLGMKRVWGNLGGSFIE